MLGKISSNRSAIITISEQFLYSFVTFAITFLLIKLFPKEEFGIWTFVVLMFNFSVTILSSLVFQPMMVEVKGKVVSLNRLNRFFFLSLCLSWVMSMLCLVVLRFRISYDGWKFFFFCFWYILMLLMVEFWRRFFIACKSSFGLIAVGVIRALGLFLALGITCKTKLEISNFLFNVSFILFLPFMLTVCFFILRSGFPKWKNLLLDFILFWRKSARWLFGKAILQFLSSQLYMLLLAFGGVMVSLGQFQSVRLLFTPLVIFAQGFSNWLIPVLSRMYSEHDISFIRKKMRKFFVFFLVGCVSFIFLVLFLQRWIVLWWYGEGEVAPFLKYSLLFCGAPLGSALLFFFSAVLLSSGRAKYIYNITLRVFAANLIISVPLVYKFGLSGALFGNALVQMISCFFYWIEAYKERLI